MKGIIFAGCSFTWGQGLYFYSDLPNVIPQSDNDFHPSKVTDAHVKYKDTLRYPRLVANFSTSDHTNEDTGYKIRETMWRVYSRIGLYVLSHNINNKNEE
jgi:hypothetical protein